MAIQTEPVVPQESGVTESLYKAYYAAPDSDPSATQLSSHWAAYSSEFDVRLDKDGNIASMKGKGFGDLGVRGIARTGLSWLCYASYWLRLSDRRRVLDLLPRAFEVCRQMGAAFSFDCFSRSTRSPNSAPISNVCGSGEAQVSA